MVNESLLLESLVGLHQRTKELYVMILACGSELAALRDTVRALDPTFDGVLAKKRQDRSVLEDARQQAKLLDDAILRLKIGLIV
jgi:hypothetical protein